MGSAIDCLRFGEIGDTFFNATSLGGSTRSVFMIALSGIGLSDETEQMRHPKRCQRRDGSFGR